MPSGFYNKYWSNDRHRISAATPFYQKNGHTTNLLLLLKQPTPIERKMFYVQFLLYRKDSLFKRGGGNFFENA